MVLHIGRTVIDTKSGFKAVFADGKTLTAYLPHGNVATYTKHAQATWDALKESADVSVS